MAKIANETPRTINGVPGRAFNVITWEGNGRAGAENEIANQQWVSERRTWTEGRDVLSMRVRMRHDDNCRNGNCTFSVTVDGFTNGRADWGGAAHDSVREHFPELSDFLQWHLASTDGPMHYFANTIYHAGDRDHYGLRKGESRQVTNRAGELLWKLEMFELSTGEPVTLGAFQPFASHAGPEAPELGHGLRWSPVLRIGEGKPRDLAAARSAAVWPDVSDSILCAEPSALRVALEARLPGLMARFRQTVIGAGFYFDAMHAAALGVFPSD